MFYTGRHIFRSWCSKSYIDRRSYGTQQKEEQRQDNLACLGVHQYWSTKLWPAPILFGWWLVGICNVLFHITEPGASLWRTYLVSYGVGRKNNGEGGCLYNRLTLLFNFSSLMFFFILHLAREACPLRNKDVFIHLVLQRNRLRGDAHKCFYSVIYLYPWSSLTNS